MALEDPFNYIDDLVETNPNGDPDQLAQADDHLRGIKKSIKGSFPNLGQAAFTGTASNLNRVAATAATIIDLIYPIGAIYCSASATDPNTLFGVGTWSALADKQTLVQQGSFAAGSSGGSSTAALPEHFHGFSGTTAASPGGGSTAAGTGASSALNSTGTHTHPFSGVTTVSGVTPENLNMPPYLAVYMWRRTA